MFAPRQRFVQGGQRSAQTYNHSTGSVTLSSSQSKFGGTSLVLPNTSSSSNVLYAPISSVWLSTYSGNFTIECWQYVNSFANPYAQSVGNNYSWASGFGGNMWGFYQHNNYPGKMSIWVGNYSSDVAFLVSTSSVSTGVWNHVAVTKNGNLYTLWWNGVAESTNTWGGTFNSSSNDQLTLGINGSGVSITAWDGYIDELRWSNVCRYTTTFTPNPNGPFIDDPNTVTLLHFDGATTSQVFVDDNS